MGNDKGLNSSVGFAVKLRVRLRLEIKSLCRGFLEGQVRPTYRGSKLSVQITCKGEGLPCVSAVEGEEQVDMAVLSSALPRDEGEGSLLQTRHVDHPNVAFQAVTRAIPGSVAAGVGYLKVESHPLRGGAGAHKPEREEEGERAHSDAQWGARGAMWWAVVCGM